MIEGNKRDPPTRVRWPFTEHGNVAVVIAAILAVCLVLWRC